MSRLTLAAALATAGAVLALPACAAPAESPAPAPPVVAQPTRDLDTPTSPLPGDAGDTTGPVEPAPTPSALSSGPPQPTATPSAGSEQPFTVRPGSIGNVRVHADIFPVRRSGQTATVNVMIVADDPAREFFLGRLLSDGNPEVGARDLVSVDGLRLIDSQNKKSYLPATTADGVCACTPADGAKLDSATVVWVSVVFAAPPVDLPTINVQIPLFGTVTDVPLG